VLFPVLASAASTADRELARAEKEANSLKSYFRNLRQPEPAPAMPSAPAGPANHTSAQGSPSVPTKKDPPESATISNAVSHVSSNSLFSAAATDHLEEEDHATPPSPAASPVGTPQETALAVANVETDNSTKPNADHGPAAKKLEEPYRPGLADLGGGKRSSSTSADEAGKDVALQDKFAQEKFSSISGKASPSAGSSAGDMIKDNSAYAVALDRVPSAAPLSEEEIRSNLRNKIAAAAPTKAEGSAPKEGEPSPEGVVADAAEQAGEGPNGIAGNKEGTEKRLRTHPWQTQDESSEIETIFHQVHRAYIRSSLKQRLL
jgi:hypothetical protein